MHLLHNVTEAIKAFAISQASTATSVSDLQGKMRGIAGVLRQKRAALNLLKLSEADIFLNPKLQQTIRTHFGLTLTLNENGTVTSTLMHSQNPAMMTSTLEARLGKDEKQWAPREIKSKNGPTDNGLINLRKLGDSYFRGSQVSNTNFKTILQNNPGQLADFLEAMAGSLAEKIIGGAFLGK